VGAIGNSRPLFTSTDAYKIESFDCDGVMVIGPFLGASHDEVIIKNESFSKVEF